MRFAIVSPQGRGTSRAAAASPDEVAAIVTALEIVLRADEARAIATPRDESRWKRAGRSYDAYDASLSRGRME